MREFSNWSISLGRWGSVNVRLHAFFLLFAVFTLYLSAQVDSGELLWLGVATVVALLASVLLHEWGHCLAAFHVGGSADEIVIGPLGGLVPIQVPPAPLPERLTAIAGPAANLFAAVLCLPLLVAAGANPLELLNPLGPTGLLDDGRLWLTFIKVLFWLNWVLAIVNLLPCFPLDGARVLRSFLWPKMGYPMAVVITAHVAQVTAFCLAAVGLIFRNSLPSEPVPAWVPLSLLAIYFFFSAKQELGRLEADERGSELFEYDFSHGYTSLEAASQPQRPGVFSRWIAARKEKKRLRQVQIEAEEERRADEILARVLDTGMDGLSAEDRSLLERVSARYRERLGR